MADNLLIRPDGTIALLDFDHATTAVYASDFVKRDRWCTPTTRDRHQLLDSYWRQRELPADAKFEQRLAFRRPIITLSYFLYWRGRDRTQLPGALRPAHRTGANMTTNETTATAAPTLVTGPGVQVVAALLRRDGHIVLVKELRDGQEMWSIPGGGVERGELFSEALIREVKEETGLNLTAVGPLAYLVNTTSDRYPSTVVVTFDCTDWDGQIQVHDPDGKVTGAVLLPLAEARTVLASSTATRPEIEPLLAYLAGRRTGRVWSYRNDQPLE